MDQQAATLRALGQITDDLVRALDKLSFAPPVTHVYNPLKYARALHDQYLTRFGGVRGRVLLMGMNPGPWGMAQSGVPFGEVTLVREYLGITGPVGRPDHEHPKRPVVGLDCPRSEVSGKRIWGWVQQHFGPVESFFERFFIVNYCPLIFLEDSGRNRVPEKLPVAERRPMLEICDDALRRTLEVLQPTYLVGIGKFAEDRLRMASQGFDIQVGRVLHPSPASPVANRGWARQAETQLGAMGLL